MFGNFKMKPMINIITCKIIARAACIISLVLMIYFLLIRKDMTLGLSSLGQILIFYFCYRNPGILQITKLKQIDYYVSKGIDRHFLLAGGLIIAVAVIMGLTDM